MYVTTDTCETWVSQRLGMTEALSQNVSTITSTKGKDLMNIFWH